MNKDVIYANTEAYKRLCKHFKAKRGQEWTISNSDDVYLILSETGLGLEENHKAELRDCLQDFVYKTHDEYLRIKARTWVD